MIMHVIFAFTTSVLVQVGERAGHSLSLLAGGPRPTPTPSFLTTPPPATGDVFDKLIYLLYKIEVFLFRLVVIVFMISLILGAILRITAFESERRKGIANTAIIGSVIGLLVIFLGPYIYQFLVNIFGSPVPIR